MKVCSKCGANEARRGQAWCNPCFNAYQKARYVPHPRQRSAVCTKCKINPPSAGNVWCKECRAAYVKQYRQDETANMKQQARVMAKNAIRAGRLIPQPCEKCEAVKAEMHHDDYFKPLEVRWLCRRCHREEHRNER
jgi:hypothetical protein